jgi:hypothetical protein
MGTSPLHPHFIIVNWQLDNGVSNHNGKHQIYNSSIGLVDTYTIKNKSKKPPNRHNIKTTFQHSTSDVNNQKTKTKKRKMWRH